MSTDLQSTDHRPQSTIHQPWIPETRQRLLELVYDLLPEREAAELRRQIDADEELARGVCRGPSHGPSCWPRRPDCRTESQARTSGGDASSAPSDSSSPKATLLANGRVREVPTAGRRLGGAGRDRLVVAAVGRACTGGIGKDWTESRRTTCA